jgi:hypothetical protein
MFVFGFCKITGHPDCALRKAFFHAKSSLTKETKTPGYGAKPLLGFQTIFLEIWAAATEFLHHF